MFNDDLIWQHRAPQSRRLAIGASVVSHALIITLGIWISTLSRSVDSGPTPIERTHNLVWIASPGPGGGGGGGGNKTPAPAPAREVGKDRLTVPATRSEPAPAEKPKEPPPLEPIEIPAKPLADSTQTLAGLIDVAPPTTTQGAGADAGAGTGKGTGSGEGRGSGVGPGFGGGIGGGAYRPGSGVSSPQLIREVKPNYTAPAMRAKVQGSVLLECVVLTDGSVGEVRIVKSLDTVFGLDEEAIKAARQWRFVPGRRLGEPVPVLVTIELGFTLR